MRRAPLALALLALPLAGCSSVQSSKSKFKGEAGKVAAVVDDLAAAGRTGNAKKICSDILARQLVQELKSAGGDCQSEMKAAIQDASDYDLRVDSVKVSGANATAKVKQGSKGKTATFAFVKENGAWRASALGG
jgi:uncharacterized protein YceK